MSPAAAGTGAPVACGVAEELARVVAGAFESVLPSLPPHPALNSPAATSSASTRGLSSACTDMDGLRVAAGVQARPDDVDTPAPAEVLEPATIARRGLRRSATRCYTRRQGAVRLRF